MYKNVTLLNVKIDIRRSFNECILYFCTKCMNILFNIIKLHLNYVKFKETFLILILCFFFLPAIIYYVTVRTYVVTSRNNSEKINVFNVHN